MEKKKTYEAAYEELQEIVNEIETGTIGVDDLGEKVKRAGELIRFCKDKLFKTEQEVNGVLKDLEK